MDNNQKANELSKKAMQLPESVQFALMTVLPNVCNGAFWGFTSVKECHNYAEALKTDKNILLGKLSDNNNVVVQVNPDYLIKAARTVDANLITDSDVNMMRTGFAEGTASFEKFLINKADQNFAGAVGIYCINDSTTITIKGTKHPAFRVDINTVLGLMQKWGFTFVVNGQRVPAEQAWASYGAKLFGMMKMSPTNSGVFIQVASSLNTAQVKQLKQQYGIGRSKSSGNAQQRRG